MMDAIVVDAPRRELLYQSSNYKRRLQDNVDVKQ